MRFTRYFILMICSSASTVQGQPDGEQKSPEDIEQPKRQSAGAFLNTNFDVEEKLEAVSRLVKAGRYSAAATAYHELAVQSGNYLIESSGGVYVEVRRHVNRLMCEWPVEGQEAVERTIGPTAQERLARAREGGRIEDLLSVADETFVTIAGAEALDEAAERSLEAGDFDTARRWWGELSAHHPSQSHRGIRWRAKAACAAAWEGDRQPIRALIEELSKTGGPTVTWAGREQLLRDFLRNVEKEESDGSQIKKNAYSGSPAIFAGSIERHFASPTTAIAQARLWRFSDWGRTFESAFDGYESTVARRDAMLRAIQSGRLLAASAVAGELPRSGGRTLIFLHDAVCAWAIDPDNPEAAVWRYSIADDDHGRPSWMLEEDTPPLYTSLYADGRLYLHMERSAPQADGDRNMTAAMVVCLDATTGRLIWQNKLEHFGTDFEQVRVDGAPLLIDDKLYVVARRRKPFGFEACHLLRLNANDGTLEFSTHLAEAATGSYGYHRATLTHAAAKGELIYVGTNLGAVAGVSRHTGRVAWLTTYASQFSEAPEGLWPTRMGRPARSWHYQPTIVWRDAVIVSPLDAEQILVFDAIDGHERFRISLEQLHMPEIVLGLVNDSLYLAGSQVVCYDLQNRRLAWQRPLPAGQVFGRGAVTSTGLFIPTDRAMVRMSLDGGESEAYPWSIEEAGNITVMPDQILSASALSVSGLVSRETAFARTTERMRDRPTDVRPALAMAELALSIGDYPASIAGAREALHRQKGGVEPADDAVRSRLYDQFMSLAATAINESTARLATTTGASQAEAHESRMNTAVAFLEMAGDCATQIDHQVTWRLQLASAHRRLRRADRAVQVYQDILLNPAWRHARIEIDPAMLPPSREREPIGDSQAARQSAGFVASLCIDRLKAESGNTIYDEIDAKAREKLASARKDGHAAMGELLEVVEAYPNSSAAPVALRFMGDRAIEQGDWHEAVDVYHRCMRMAPPVDRPAIVVDLIDAFMSGGQKQSAAEWVTRAARDFPAFEFVRRGEQHTFKTYGAARLGEMLPREPAHDVAVTAATRSYSLVFGDNTVVLEPAFARLPHTTWDALVTYSEGRVESRAAATGRSLWPKPAPVVVQPTMLGMDATRYLFATPQRVFALTRSDGRAAWEVGEEIAPDPQSDPEEVATFSMHVLTSTRLYSANDRGELLAIDLADGGIRWRAAARLPVGGLLAANDRFVCHTAWQENAHAIAVLDAATGRVLRSLRSSDDWPIQTIFVTDRDLAIIVVSNGVTAFDLHNGATVWTISSEERFQMGSIQIDDEGLMMSCDGRRISKYGLRDGQPLWTSKPLADGPVDGMWAEGSDGRLIVVQGDRVSVLDTANGMAIWSKVVNGLLRIEPIRISRDHLIALVEAGAAESRAERAAFGSLTDEQQTERTSGLPNHDKETQARYVRILGFDLDTGQPRRLRAGRAAQSRPAESEAGIVSDSIVSDALTSFGGLFVRNNTIILLDGRRMICYVADKP